MTEARGDGHGPVRAFDPVLLGVAAVWGANFVVMKALLEPRGPFSPFGLLCVRYALMALLLVSWLKLVDRPPALELHHWPRLIAIGVVGFGVQQGLLFEGLQRTTAAEASLLLSTSPLWTAILGALFASEVLTRRNWFGVALAFGGTALVLLGSGANLTGASSHLLPNLLVLIAGFLYGGYMVASKPLIEDHGALNVVAWSAVAALLVVGPLGARDAWHLQWSRVPLSVWGGLAYLVLLAGSTCFVLWYRSVERVGPARTAVYQYLVPIFSLIVGLLWLHESPAPLQLVGVGVTLLGIWLARQPAPAAQGSERQPHETILPGAAVQPTRGAGHGGGSA